LDALALVAAGLFVYDRLRGGGAMRPVEVVEPLPVRPSPRTEPRPPPPVEAQGGGLDGMLGRLDRLEARIAVVEEATSRRGAGSAREGDRGEAVVGPASWEPGAASGGTSSFDPRAVAWFRALKAEADRQERRERQVASTGQQIDLLQLALTDEQRTGVIDATLDYREKMRALFRQPDYRTKTPEDRREILQGLHDDYETALRRLLSAEDATRVVERLGRYPGIGRSPFGAGR
ncbi:MAG: hypothetical protein ACC662_11085, partial [Planctomycetota bacterium]